MKKVTLIISILLGLMLIIFGLNGFLQFMPMPEMADPGQQFIGALMQTGYILAIVAIVEILAGILILINKYQALALIVLFPILLNAFLFHLFLDIQGIGASVFALILTIYLLINHKEKFSALLKP